MMRIPTGWPRVLLVAGWVGVSPAHAADTERIAPGWLLDRWTVDDGLPLDHLTGLALAADGQIWVSTFNGLARFDGHTFQVFRQADTPALPSNRFVSVVADASGAIWALTEAGSVVRWRDQAFTVWAPEALPDRISTLQAVGGRAWAYGFDTLFQLDEGGPTPWAVGAAPRRLQMLRDDGAGGLWAGTWSTGVVHLDETGAALSRHALPARTELRALLAEGSSRALAAADSGVFPFGGDPTPRSVPTGEVTDLWRGADGRLALKQGTGLWVDAEGTWTASGACARVDMTVTEASRDGVTWNSVCGSVSRDGVGLWSDGKDVEALVVDDQGQAWLSIRGGGLARIRPALVERVGIAGNARSVLTDPSGAIWAILKDHGVVRVDQPDAPPVDALGAPGEPGAPFDPTSLYAPPEGGLLVGVRGAVCRWTPTRCVPVAEQGSEVLDVILALHESAEGALWIGGHTGLFRVPGRDGAWPGPWQEITLDGARVPWTRALLATPDGALWIGSGAQGLLRWRDGKLERVGAPGALTNVRGLHRDERGVIWAATEGQGVCRVAPAAEGPLVDTAITCIGSQAGLGADATHSVSEDATHRLWISSNEGLIVADRAELDAFAAGETPRVRPLRLAEREGMPDREANGGHQGAAAWAPGERLLFPTQAGVVEVSPAAVVRPPPPAVHLDTLLVAGQAAPPGRAEALGADDRDVTLRWTTAPVPWAEQVYFRYRLVGYSTAWSADTLAREVNWTNLPPGRTRFEVQAGLGGQWGPSSTLDLQRAPSFVESIWFRVVLIAGGVAFAGLAAWLRLIRVQRRAVELERAVRLRTAELAEANQRLAAQATQLRDGNERLTTQAATLEAQADRLQDQAERLTVLDRQKTNFFENISHELRTPLALVLGALHDLLPGAPRPETHALQRATRNAERLQTLVEQLLDTMWLDKGTVPLLVRRLDLAAFLRFTVDRFMSAAAARGLGVSVEVDGPAHVYFDPDLLDKVLTNLLGNAMKFTPEGGAVSVRLSTWEDQPVPMIRVDVTDTGPGISEAQRAIVFTRFFQGDAGKERRFGGIGLSLVQEFVALHGGEVGVDAGPHGGSRFWFTLPLGGSHFAIHQLDPEPGPAEPAPEALLAEIEPAPRSEERPLVLVAEDHPDMRDWLVEHLSGAWRVVAAVDGAEALELAHKHRPAAVISDVMMPRMDGLELCRRLRADPELTHTPVLLLSAKAAEHERVEGLELATDYLTKPFGMAELLARTRRMVRAAQPPPSGTELGAAGLPLVDQGFLTRVAEIVDESMADENFGVEALARRLGLSRRQLLREFGRLLDSTPNAWIRERKLVFASNLLQSGATSTVAEVAARVGLTPNYFTSIYTSWAGHPPSTASARRG